MLDSCRPEGANIQNLSIHLVKKCKLFTSKALTIFACIQTIHTTDYDSFCPLAFISLAYFDSSTTGWMKVTTNHLPVAQMREL
jgi:hypothetical protein